MTLEDGFGDSWGSAQLIVYPSWIPPYTLSMTCGDIQIKKKVCFSSEFTTNNDFIVISVVGHDVKRNWEVRYLNFNPQILYFLIMIKYIPLDLLASSE